MSFEKIKFAKYHRSITRYEKRNNLKILNLLFPCDSNAVGDIMALFHKF